MKKEKELIESLKKIIKEASINNIRVSEIEIPFSWASDIEDKVPEYLLGVKIKRLR